MGYPSSSIARDIHFVADTIRLEGLDGTGTLLGIDINGDVTRVLGVGAGGVTGLNDYEPLFGSLTGIIEQDNFWYYDPTIQYMRLGDPSGSAGGEIGVVNGTNASSITATSMGVSGSVGQTIMDGQYFTLYDLDAELFSIGRATWSTDEVLLFPAAKGALNQSLQVSNVTGDNVTLSWFTPTSGTVTSFAFTDGSGFDGTVTNATTTPSLALTTTVGDNRVMYSNSGGVTGSSLFTYDDAAGVERLDVSAFDFIFRGSTTYTNGLIYADDGGTVFLGANSQGNTTSLFINDSGEEIAMKADNGVKISNFAAGDALTYIVDATDVITPVTLTANDFNFSGGTLSIDYTNGQTANTSTKGFLTDTDWDTFNNKVGLVHSEEHTAQTTSTGATTVYTTPAADGYYRISVTATVTTAAGSAMDLAVQLRYTEATDNVNKTFPTANVNNYNRTQTNTTGATVAISSVCHVKASTDIKYLTGWSPTGGSPQYNVHITVEKL